MPDFKYYSYSQVNTFADCERKHYFAYREGLTSRITSDALIKGTIFHEALRAFYKAMQQGLDKDKCISAAKRVVINTINENEDLEFLTLELYGMILQYAKYYYDEDNAKWEIVAVEETFEFPELEFLIIADLIVRNKSGRYKGRLETIDFKTTNQFWSQKQKDTAVQVPKYNYALRTLPQFKDIDLGTIGQIRSVNPKKVDGPADWLRRDTVETPTVLLENVWNQHSKLINRIKAYEQLSEAEHFKEAVPALTFGACRFCIFSDICTMANQGRTFEVTKATQFKKKEK